MGSPCRLIWPLEEAIKQGDAERARKIIRETGKMFVGKSHYLHTPLTFALKEKQAGVVQMMLKEGADIQTPGSMFEEAPLVTATRTGELSLVQLLLDSGADININGVSDRGAEKLVYTTPLHIAATQKNPDMLNLLLAANAHVSLRNIKHKSPLHIAAYSGHVTHVQRLLACGAQVEGVDKAGLTPLHHTISQGHSACVLELVKAGSSLNFPTNQGSTPLMLAIEKHQLNILKLLLRFGADPNRTEGSLNRAATHIVIEACPHPTSRKKIISVNEEIECLESLLEAGADINLQDDKQESAFHLCVRNGCVDLLEYMIKYPLTNITLLNAEFHTALSLAISIPHTAMIRLLVQHCPLLVNYCTKPPLMFSLIKHKDPLSRMRLLLEAGYLCSRAEAERCRESCETLPEVVTFVDESLLQPWPLLRLCRLRIRERLSTALHRKIFKLPLPQSLRNDILLKDYRY